MHKCCVRVAVYYMISYDIARQMQYITLHWSCATLYRETFHTSKTTATPYKQGIHQVAW